MVILSTISTKEELSRSNDAPEQTQRVVARERNSQLQSHHSIIPHGLAQRNGAEETQKKRKREETEQRPSTVNVRSDTIRTFLRTLGSKGIDPDRVARIRQFMKLELEEEEEEWNRRYDILTQEKVDVPLDAKDMGITQEQLTKFKWLLATLRDVFNPGKAKRWRTSIVNDLKEDATPVRHRPANEGPVQQRVISDMIQEHLDKGWIEKSRSKWGSRLVVARKPSGGWRCALDLRDVNKQCKIDPMPMPRADNVLQALSGSNYMSVIDASSAFLGVPLDDASADVASFVCRQGHYRYLRMPYGWINASPEYVRFMNSVLDGLLWECVVTYIDDCIVYTKKPGFEPHFNALRQVLKRMVDNGVGLKPQKCAFFRKNVTVIGYDVSKDGVRPSESRIKPIVDMPLPTTKAELRTQLQKFNFYRRNVPGFAKRVHNLNKFLNAPEAWTDKKLPENCMKELKEMRELFTDPNGTVLAHFDADKPVTLHIDASDHGIGGVLHQEHNGRMKPVQCVSRALRGPESRYCIWKRECLAVVWCVRILRHFLSTDKLTIVTDNSSTAQMTKHEKGVVARWALELEQYRPSWVLKSGKDNPVADCMSRFPTNVKYMHDDGKPTFCATADSEKSSQEQTVANSVSEATALTDALFLEKQEEDKEFCGPMMELLLRANPGQATTREATPAFRELAERMEKGTSEERPGLKRQAGKYCLHPASGVLFLRTPAEKNKLEVDPTGGRVVVPKSLRLEVIDTYHSAPLAGHRGQWKCRAAIEQLFFWRHMRKDIDSRLRGCLVCKRRKTTRPMRDGLMKPMLDQHEPFSHVVIDIQGKLPKVDGYEYLLTAVCAFTHYCFAIPIQNRSIPAVTQAIFDNIICQHGSINVIKCDGEGSFNSGEMKAICKALKPKMDTGSPYSPNSQSAVERFHRYLNATTTILANKYRSNWPDLMPPICFAYRMSVNATSGFSPFELVHGRRARMPLNLLSELHIDKMQLSPGEYHATVVNNLKKVFKQVQERQRELGMRRKAAADVQRKPVTYEKGDLVLLWEPENVLQHPSPDKRVMAPKKYRFQWSRDVLEVKEKLDSTHYLLLRQTKKEEKKEIRAAVNRMAIYHPWDSNWQQELSSKMEKERKEFLNDKKTYCTSELQPPQAVTALEKGALIIAAEERINGNPFIEGKITRIHKDQDEVDVHWYGNYHNLPLGTYLPGYVDTKDNKLVWDKKKKRGYKSYTSTVSTDDGKPIRIERKAIVFYKFKLLADNTLPESLIELIDFSSLINWNLPSQEEEHG